MATGIYSWSQTAASNNAADSTINWTEGQLPSTVNDSARAVMAIIAKWRDDLAGVKPANAELVTAGAINAMTLTTNGSISPPALTHGWTISFKVGGGLTNTSACTLSVDTMVAKQLQLVSGSNLNGGELVAGCQYTATYHQPSDSWQLHRSVGEFPSGTRTLFNQTTAPVGWTKDTSAAYNDACPRLVTGSVGTGGSTVFSTIHSSRTISQAMLN